MTPLDEIAKLYFEATRATIHRDIARAIALLKQLPTEELRERAVVYMDGLAQMRAEWGGRRRKPSAPGTTAPRRDRGGRKR